jgi:hypothetical protein
VLPLEALTRVSASGVRLCMRGRQQGGAASHRCVGDTSGEGPAQTAAAVPTRHCNNHVTHTQH